MTESEWKIHWEHTANLYQDLSNYFEFMVCDGNIEKPTYDLLSKKLDELFDEYRKLHQELGSHVTTDSIENKENE